MRHAAPIEDHISDDELLELVQRQTFRFFWDYADPASGLARDRGGERKENKTLVATGGTGIGIMAMIVAVERGWIDRLQSIQRLAQILSFFESADSYRGAFPHYFNGETGEEVAFWFGNAGGDIIETALLMAGLLSARQYFCDSSPAEAALRRRINRLWQRTEWSWFTGGERVLLWHWGFEHGWGTRQRVRGWDECLIAYVLAASSPTYPICPNIYHAGWTASPTFRNGGTFYGHRLPLGPPYGGPLFFSYLPFLGLDPRELRDRYANYWEQVVQHTLINYEHCVSNPGGFKGYGPQCWGLTASDGPGGYAAHAPEFDRGVVAPAAALSSFPYAPEHSMRALKHFYFTLGPRIWRNYGFVDAFSESANWYADEHLAISQGPTIVMIENYRTGLLWRLFMSCSEVQQGLDALDFSPRGHAPQ